MNASATHDNYHQAELDKFAALANRWWDRDGPQRALHGQWDSPSCRWRGW